MKIAPVGGEILIELRVDPPGYNIDDEIVLPDGTVVVVIGVNDSVSEAGWLQAVYVGTKFDHANVSGEHKPNT